MANAWFRMYAEFATDPKVQRLSETDQRRYVMLLCMRCNGDVTLQDEDVTFQLRISNDEWCKTKAVLATKNLIDSNNKPTAWDKRQYTSDSSAARVSKHRALQKQACNVTVTPQNRTEQNRSKPSAENAGAFSEFWSKYPKKVGKGAAEIAWKRAKVNGSASALMQALDKQCHSEQWNKDGGQYVPNPATWLNQKRWLDGEQSVISQFSGVL